MSLDLLDDLIVKDFLNPWISRAKNNFHEGLHFTKLGLKTEIRLFFRRRPLDFIAALVSTGIMIVAAIQYSEAGYWSARDGLLRRFPGPILSWPLLKNGIVLLAAAALIVWHAPREERSIRAFAVRRLVMMPLVAAVAATPALVRIEGIVALMVATGMWLLLVAWLARNAHVWYVAVFALAGVGATCLGVCLGSWIWQSALPFVLCAILTVAVGIAGLLVSAFTPDTPQMGGGS